MQIQFTPENNRNLELGNEYLRFRWRNWMHEKSLMVLHYALLMHWFHEIIVLNSDDISSISILSRLSLFRWFLSFLIASNPESIQSNAKLAKLKWLHSVRMEFVCCFCDSIWFGKIRSPNHKRWRRRATELLFVMKFICLSIWVLKAINDFKLAHDIYSDDFNRTTNRVFFHFLGRLSHRRCESVSAYYKLNKIKIQQQNKDAQMKWRKSYYYYDFVVIEFVRRWNWWSSISFHKRPKFLLFLIYF